MERADKMTLTKRIIPCLDIKNDRVVKGIHFTSLMDAGDPVDLAARYEAEAADELIFLDITASQEKRKLMADLAAKIAKKIFIPFTIGGGIQSVADMDTVLHHGADKIAINTAAVRNPQLIREGARHFGAQCIVLAVDVKKTGREKWNVYIYGGKKKTDLDALDWIKQAVDLGAGEILLTSMDSDGTKNGFDLQITRQVSEQVSVPVIASGGGGEPEHFYNAIQSGKADAVLAASVFHYNTLKIKELKEYLHGKGIPVRRLK